jgi:predicted TIM-barrel fold metal-dependent hydrolase
MIDFHIHLHPRGGDREEFWRALEATGLDGCLLVSDFPADWEFGSASAEERLDKLCAWTGTGRGIRPLFWVDPLEEAVLEQVELAVERGVAGFKIICHKYYPRDERCLEVCRAIAAHDLPIMFHAGILWDGRDSARFNRPGEFEALLAVPRLRFSLAHIAWPWVDELIAVYGKFLNSMALRPEVSCEMFIDLTPGTPPIYRREALTKVFTVGYDVAQHVVFGSDGWADQYDAGYFHEWKDRDDAIYDEVGVGPEVRRQVYHDNALRFLGELREDTPPAAPLQAT